MQWEKPKYSRKSVRRAGELIATEGPPMESDEVNEYIERLVEAYYIFDNWRSAHAYPLNAFQVTLRSRAKRVDPDALTAQRLKRSPSIVAKLRRFDNMDLARMQDIGGCRAIVRDVSAVYSLWHVIESARARHILEDFDDYIAEPKDDGYRGVHLIYKYVGRGDSSIYSGLRIEIQLRTQIQHAWATAVETVGLFRREAIKSGEGNARWREFFCVASEAFSILEQGDTVPDVTRGRVKSTLVELINELDVFYRLSQYKHVLRMVEQEKDAEQYLLELDFVENDLTVLGFSRRDQEVAQEAYTRAEKRLGSNGDVVLVSVENVMALRKAFPNYFADTTLFISTLSDVLSWQAEFSPEVVFDPSAIASDGN